MIAVCSVIMLLRRGSIDRLIQSEFTDYYDTKEIFPMALHREGKVDKSEMDGNAYDIAKADIQSFENSWDKYLQLPVLNTEKIIYLKGKMGSFKY